MCLIYVCGRVPCVCLCECVQEVVLDWIMSVNWLTPHLHVFRISPRGCNTYFTNERMNRTTSSLCGLWIESHNFVISIEIEWKNVLRKIQGLSEEWIDRLFRERERSVEYVGCYLLREQTQNYNITGTIDLKLIIIIQ